MCHIGKIEREGAFANAEATVTKMKIGEAARKRIMELCDERGITLNKLATICGITQSTLNNVVSGRNNSVTLSTVKKICDGLNCSIIDFFTSPVFDGLEQEIQ